MSKSSLQNDPDQRLLRQVLTRASRLYSADKIIREAAKLRKNWTFTEAALRKFLQNEKHRLTPKNYTALADYWLYTPLGRALRHPDPNKAPIFDQLTRVLASGQETMPDGKTAHGLYFVYHGSYIKRDHYVVRVLKIDANDDHVLTVVDTIQDKKSAKERIRKSSGVMIFVDNTPQIVLYGVENKRGLSLMIGTEAEYDEGEVHLDSVVGAFLVKNKTHALAYRRFLMVRKPGGVFKDMLTETGIFTRKELRAVARKEHSAAFDKLAEQQENATPFEAPILNYQSDGQADPL